MKNKGMKIRETIKQHIINNKKEYIIVVLIFIVGIFLGVFFVNHMQEAQRTEMQEYLNHFIEQMKTTERLDLMGLLKTSMIQNTILAVLIWFFGTTVIGIPVVFAMVLYRGFCLGYTVSICVIVMGMTKGISFSLINLFLPSLFFIPAILALAVSGFKLYQSIVKDKRKENVKMEILRHTVFSFIMLGILLIASFVEIFVSTNLLKLLIKYF